MPYPSIRGTRANCTLSVGFTSVQFCALREAAAEHRVSMAEIVRGIVDSWLAANPQYEQDVPEMPALPHAVRVTSLLRADHSARMQLAHNAVKDRAAKSVPMWPHGYEWRPIPPKGEPFYDVVNLTWNEVDVWCKEAQKRGIEEQPTFTPLMPGEQLDEWQLGLRAALGMSEEM